MKRQTISLAKSPWKGLLLTGSVLATLVACGDDSDKSNGVEMPVREVSSIFELGPCNADRQGDTILVLDKASEYLCSNNDWVEIATPFENGSSGNVEGSQTFSSSSSFVDNKTADSLVVKDASIMGAAHKGPFKFNSPIMLREAALRNDSLVFTGRKYIDEISSNKGDFVIPKVSLVSPYVVLEVRGQWRNEISGEWSNDSMTLYALTDLSNRDEVNINLLTHLEMDRAQSLINKGYSVYAAKKQAEFEIMTAFGFATTVENAEDLKTFVSSGDAAHDANATLMAISLLFIGERNDAEIQSAINNFKKDLEKDGVWDDAQTKANMADWAEGFDGGSIRANVKSWNILDIPNYENFLTVFWNNAYELGGCASTRLGVVAQNKNEKSRNYNTYYICKTAGWQKATDYEKDTYQWTNGKDGDVRKGNVTPTYYTFENGNWVVAKNENVLGLCDSKRAGELAKVDATYFTCKNEKWNYATALEYDTYGFGVGKDGEVRVGKINTDQYYVYENGSWRAVTNTIEKDLGACVTSREGEVGKSGDTYYICKSRSWTTATAMEYDTYGWTAGTEGEVRAGNVSVGWYYVYEDGSWRASEGGLENNLGGCVTSREGELGKAYETYYICKSKVWTEASVLEYDTYGWVAGTEGEVKQGNVNKSNYYVYESGRWRIASAIEKDLGVCIAGREGEIGKSNDSYYTCKLNGWQMSTTLEYDTYNLVCVEDGSIANGVVNKEIKYVCDAGLFRQAYLLEIRLNKGCVSYTDGDEIRKSISDTQDSVYYCENSVWNKSVDWRIDLLYDSRDGHLYKTTVIGEQTWMAENLNYSTSNSYCRKDSMENCSKYGRFYRWSAAMDSAGVFSQNGKGCGANVICDSDLPIRGICPEGWHLPSFSEWYELISFVGGANSEKLKSKSGWNSDKGNGTDVYSFTALPAGYWNLFSSLELGQSANFWSSTSSGEMYVCALYISSVNIQLGTTRVFYPYDRESDALSVRCIKD